MLNKSLILNSRFHTIIPFYCLILAQLIILLMQHLKCIFYLNCTNCIFLIQLYLLLYVILLIFNTMKYYLFKTFVVLFPPELAVTGRVYFF